ncbi:hypothetical protein CLI64_18195 [Nostoc sp. CENA543]|uniref:hypothetical protein n=1 Tax=Nostoc sp. CENA543 TaxID=1869241 RepID=UPI000CA2CE0D|nr:hypothetical protein [Nostoc sp. CENA543]AUT02158.1 hypothetical protein CLI64_18195 [Nostoc sp. CENA543]
MRGLRCQTDILVKPAHTLVHSRLTISLTFKMTKPPDNQIKIEAGTVVLIISVLILLPLLFAGFFLQ